MSYHTSLESIWERSFGFGYGASSSHAGATAWDLPVELSQQDEKLLDRFRRLLPRESHWLDTSTPLPTPESIQYALRHVLRDVEREIANGSDFRIVFDPFLVHEADEGATLASPSAAGGPTSPSAISSSQSGFRRLSLLESLPRDGSPTEGLPSLMDRAYTHANSITGKAHSVLHFIAHTIKKRASESNQHLHYQHPGTNKLPIWLQHLATEGELIKPPQPKLTRVPTLTCTPHVTDSGIPQFTPSQLPPNTSPDPRLRLPPPASAGSGSSSGSVSSRSPALPYFALRKSAANVAIVSIGSGPKDDDQMTHDGRPTESKGFWRSYKSQDNTSKMDTLKNRAEEHMPRRAIRRSTLDAARIVYLDSPENEMSVAQLLPCSLVDQLSYEAAAILEAAWLETPNSKQSTASASAQPASARVSRNLSAFRYNLYHFGYFRPYLHKWGHAYQALAAACEALPSPRAAEAHGARVPLPITSPHAGRGLNAVERPSAPVSLKPDQTHERALVDLSDLRHQVESAIFEALKRSFELNVASARQMVVTELRALLSKAMPHALRQYAARQKYQSDTRQETVQPPGSLPTRHHDEATLTGLTRKRLCVVCMLELTKPSPFAEREDEEPETTRQQSESDAITAVTCCGIVPCPVISQDPEHYTGPPHGEDRSCTRSAHVACLRPVYDIVSDRVGILGVPPSDVNPLLLPEKQAEQRRILTKLLDSLRGRRGKKESKPSNRADSMTASSRALLADQMRLALLDFEPESDDIGTNADSGDEDQASHAQQQRKLAVANVEEWDMATAWLSARNPSSQYSTDSLKRKMAKTDLSSWGGLTKLEAGRFIAWGSWQCASCTKAQTLLVSSVQQDIGRGERPLQSRSANEPHEDDGELISGKSRPSRHTHRRGSRYAVDSSEELTSSEEDEEDYPSDFEGRTRDSESTRSRSSRWRRRARYHSSDDEEDEELDSDSETSGGDDHPPEQVSLGKKSKMPRAQSETSAESRSRKKTKRSDADASQAEDLSKELGITTTAPLDVPLLNTVYKVTRGLLQLDPAEYMRPRKPKVPKPKPPRLAKATATAVTTDSTNTDEAQKPPQDQAESDDNDESDEEDPELDVPLTEIKMESWGHTSTKLSSRGILTKFLKQIATSQNDGEVAPFLEEPSLLPEFLHAAHKQASERQKTRTKRRLLEQLPLQQPNPPAAQTGAAEADAPIEGAGESKGETGMASDLNTPPEATTANSFPTTSAAAPAAPVITEERTQKILDAGFRYLSKSECDAVLATYKLLTEGSKDGEGGVVGGKKVLDHVTTQLSKVISGAVKKGPKDKYADNLANVVEEVSKILSILDPYVVANLIKAARAKAEVAGLQVLKDFYDKSQRTSDQVPSATEFLKSAGQGNREVSKLLHGLVSEAKENVEYLESFWEQRFAAKLDHISEQSFQRGSPFALSTWATGAGQRTDSYVFLPRPDENQERNYFPDRLCCKMMPITLMRSMHATWRMKRAIELTTAKKNKDALSTAAGAKSSHISPDPSTETLAFRSKRSEQRQLGRIGAEIFIDNLGGTTLQKMQKRLRFRKSLIHEFGVFCEEPVSAGEVVVEYLGEYVKLKDADRREEMYAELGIGSSYMFRVDQTYVIDATRKGNIARFINHSCDPNCIAKILNKRIVICAKKDIAPGDELTYDYKFPIEATNKIPCLCGSEKCRGFLN